jgi:hypothetical protein
VLARLPGHSANKHKAQKERISNALGFLKKHTPVTNHVALPPNLPPVPTKFVKLPGPITGEYSAVTVPLPTPRKKPAFEVNSQLPPACTLAKIELFYDKSLQKFNVARTWARLRILDPTLQPWGIHETIADVNPQILDEDHVLQQCFGAFWLRNYSTVKEISRPKDSSMVYCRGHDQYEVFDPTAPALLMQLGAGFLSETEWVYVITHQQVGKSLHVPDDVEGSHGCGNGVVSSSLHPDNCGCVSPVCIRWEKRLYNGQRKGCHGRSEAASDDNEVECICIPGLDLPYILGRSHLSHHDLQRQSLRHFNAIRDERDSTTGKKENAHGRCPFCQKEVIIDIRLSGFLKDSNVNVLIKHMNLNRSTSLAPLERSGKFTSGWKSGNRQPACFTNSFHVNIYCM